MPTNDYHFIDRWRVEGDIREVVEILEDDAHILARVAVLASATVVSRIPDVQVKASDPAGTTSAANLICLIQM